MGFKRRGAGKRHLFIRNHVVISYEEVRLGCFDLHYLFQDARKRGFVEELIRALSEKDLEIADHNS